MLMARVVPLSFVALVGSVGLTACSDAPNLTSPSSKTLVSLAQAADMRDGPMVELERQIPGFGGLYISYVSKPGVHPHPRGPIVLHVYLTSSGDEARTKKLLKQRFTEKGYIVKAVRTHATPYTFRQLRQWRDQTESILHEKQLGVVSFDADEARSKVAIGVESAAIASVVRALISASSVPSSAVIIEVEGRPVKEQFTQNGDLQSTFTPTVPAGVEIYLSGGTCTLGFHMQGNPNQFATASHCTEVEFGTDTLSTAIYQPTGGGFIGVEYWDVAPLPAGNCPYGYPCRFSDVAFASWQASDRTQEFGKVAATTNQTGSIQIDPNRPRLNIIGKRYGLYVGNVVDKIGAAGGWTYGNVTSTCQDITSYQTSPRVDLICVDKGDYVSTVGDSGAPILIWYLDDRAELAGVHFGRYTNGSFSSIEGIEKDYGTLAGVF